MLPKISVITVCLNSEATIRHTIASVNQQTYESVEHVFIDGASSDRTLSIIQKTSKSEKIVYSAPDKGIYHALNKGINLATGDVIGLLHADDFYASPLVLEEIAGCFSAGVSGVYGDLQYVGKKNPDRVIRHWQAGSFSQDKLRRGWMPPHPTLFIRRDWYDEIGGFDTSYRIAADYLSVLKLFTHHEFKAVYLNKVLVKMRVGGASNRSIGNVVLKSREDLRALRSQGVGGFYILILKNLRKLGQFL